MAAKKKSAPRKKAATSEAVHTTSAVAVVMRNLVNMAIVTASSGTVLLALMVVKNF